MSLTSAVAPVEPLVADAEVAALWAVIDRELLTAMGWDGERHVLLVPQNDVQLGWQSCAVQECGKSVRMRGEALCRACWRRWQRTETPLEVFVGLVKPLQRSIGVQGCDVPGCQRPWRTSRRRLCAGHDWQRQKAGESLEVFLARTDLVAYTTLGPCSVVACTRDRVGQAPYCQAHEQRLRAALRADPDLDVSAWHAITPAIATKGEVSLRGLAPRVVAELLYGVQQRLRSGARTPEWLIRRFSDEARAVGAARVDGVPLGPLCAPVRQFAGTLVRALDRIGSSPEVERGKDVWDLTVFGAQGWLRFTGLRQPWLRSAAQLWAAEDLPKRRGHSVGRVVAHRVAALVALSDSLYLQRPDHGQHPAVLSRRDVTAFTNRLAYLVAEGSISAGMRLRWTRFVRGTLDDMRSMGLTRPGQPLQGLADDFRISSSDIPDGPDEFDAGKDLPSEVMQHLAMHLPALEQVSTPDLRAAVELLIDTGRRPNEIATLDLDCLDRDVDDSPVLIYDNHKANRRGRRLPISAATAAVVVAQQERVRARYPDTPTAELKLLPAVQKNPHGRKPMTAANISERHRHWVTQLPDVVIPTVVNVGGTAATKLLPFDKMKITPYAYRHTYAQRHADAGVDVTVLRELMDHRLLSTTQGYYRVGEHRRRAAVERVTVMQFDRHGNRTWRTAQTMLESEHARRAVGAVAVPYGSCSEPANVAAGGQDCPVRFRCVGCSHFRIRSACCARSCCRLGERVWRASGSCSGSVVAARRASWPAMSRPGGQTLWSGSGRWGSGIGSRSWCRRRDASMRS
ncbi:site-specific integrase [Dactylosporangium sp. NPDC050688]|uniref:tyrosine-type recombinase/integrase n=1 Tax=Dactylosporangium sp. NPDC050688 TaxID=3157217 RepID=UPI0033E74BC9